MKPFDPKRTLVALAMAAAAGLTLSACDRPQTPTTGASPGSTAASDMPGPGGAGTAPGTGASR